jgi:23S rRNA pseudouridine955/2504/2580 synthase
VAAQRPSPRGRPPRQGEPASRRRAEGPRSAARQEATELRALVIYRDDHVIALNKPPGLAVQGGTGVRRHLDGMLEALRFGAPERPRLVHRLDKDTSGVLLIARNAKAAGELTAAFRRREARKVYWAAVVGVPKPRRGKVGLPLAKAAGARGERVAADLRAGKRALTLYAFVESAGSRAAWLALMPLTGRTHQLRVHCAALGTPIIGDGKYGGARAYLKGEGISDRLHLHAREIAVPKLKGGTLRVTAPLPQHMRETWAFFGFDPDFAGDPFAGEGD